MDGIMKLIKGRTYTNDVSDLAIKILNHVYYSSKGYVKFKGLLYNKRNGIVYETKNYKLDSDVPEKSNWRILNESTRS